MNENKIQPEKITKPIQLLAAWLVGLIIVNASFLIGAQQIESPEWASALLVISSVANVPIFIGSLFLLQTKFRPQMQEDSYYSQYLENERRAGGPKNESIAQVVEKEISETAEKIIKSLGIEGKGKEQPLKQILRESQNELLLAKYAGSRALSELYLSPDTWEVFCDKWSKNKRFIADIEPLLEDGLIEKTLRDYRSCRLTEVGTRIAETAEKNGLLFSQKKSEFWEKAHRELVDENA